MRIAFKSVLGGGVLALKSVLGSVLAFQSVLGGVTDVELKSVPGCHCLVTETQKA